MNDLYDTYDLINTLVRNLGLDGFDAWLAGQDEDVREEIINAQCEHGYKLKPYQRIPTNSPVWTSWYEEKHDELLERGQNIKALGDLDLENWRVWLL